MTNKEAIDILRNAAWLGTDAEREQIEEAVEMAINALNAQDEKRTEMHGVCLDTIDRKAAIDAHYEYCNKHPDAGFPVWSLKILENLPSVQPEIIRCKDCKYGDTFHEFDDPEMPMKCIGHHYGGTYPDDFCSYAERRTDCNGRD